MVIAKLHGKGKDKYEKILSGSSLYNIPQVFESAIDYDPKTTIEEDSWYAIQNFSGMPYCLELLRTPFESFTYDSLSVKDFDKLNYIVSYQDNEIFCFQKIFKSMLVEKKRISCLGDDYRYAENEKSIVINPLPDAVFNKKLDSLFFKNLSTISSVFPNIGDLYREATESETSAFLEYTIIKCVQGFSVTQVGKPNRKRIALLQDRINNMEKDDRSKIVAYTREYCPHLKCENDQFIVNSDNDLKYLLYGLDERYYTTPIGSERRCANSVMVLKPNETATA
jgi:hypothetical protein